MLYRFFFILMIFSQLLFAESFCKYDHTINLIKFFVLDNNKDYQYLEEGIPRFIYSYLRSKFFIASFNNPTITINQKSQCSQTYLATVKLKLDSKANVQNDLDIKTQLKNLSLQLDADSIITGTIQPNEKNLKVKIYYFNSLTNDFLEKQIFLNKEDPYQEENQKILKENIFNIYKYITRNNLKKIFIKTSLKDYSVYVNDISYGKNLESLELPEDDFKISVYHEDCKKTYFTNQIKNSNIYFDCDNNIKKLILIDSEPTNADVFVDERFVGKTPLSLDLPEKIYRVRISSDGYIDKNILIDLQKSSTNKIFVSLNKGNNQEYYYQKQYAISNWTYYDLSFGMAIQSLFFAGGWAYTQVQKEKVLDSVRSPFIPNYFINPLELTLIQYAILENARKKSIYWHRQGQLYGGLGILSLFASGYFLYKGIQSDQQKKYEILVGNKQNFSFYFSYLF